MMSNFVFILLVEVILVLLISLIVLLVFNWKRKKKNAIGIERLLVQVEESESTRKEHLVNFLTGQLSMEEQPALQQAEELMAAEKRFTQQFLEIQLNQQSASDFYQHSREFVDKYMQLIAEKLPKAINDNLDITSESSPEEQKDVNNSEAIEEERKDGEVQDVQPKSIETNSEESDSSEGKEIDPENVDETASENVESKEADKTPSSEAKSIEETKSSEGEEDEFAEEPDWGDAFAETGEEMDESLLEQDLPPTESKAESVEETNTSDGVEDEFAEEPDWGDAFAETGEEMDESLLEPESKPTNPQS
jgi:hypothetical protein